MAEGLQMITVEQAHRIVRRNTPDPVSEKVILTNAAGRVLAEEIRAAFASPSCTNSSMDGFALKRDALTEESSALPCAGESSAGHPYTGRPDPACCVKISTGAMLPDWCDTVVPVEHTTTAENGMVFFNEPVEAGQFARPEGSEYPEAEVLLCRGERLDPSRIGLLASQGIADVPVCRRPRVALIFTGSELVSWDSLAEKYQVRDSNSLMLSAAVEACGALPVAVQRAADSLEETVLCLNTCEPEADLIVFSGGISVGEHDHVREAVLSCGYEELFWRIRQKPGKPLFFARKGEKLLFGLPGNPVSSYMNFILYLYPLLTAMGGMRKETECVRAVMGDDVINNGDRITYFRVSLEKREGAFPLVRVIGRQESFMSSSLTCGDGFITVDIGQTMKKGAEVTVRLLPWRE